LHASCCSAHPDAPSPCAALNALERGELRIIPERFDKVYSTWLSGIQDWCVSRQLWWGHRIPVWYVHANAAAAAAATAEGGKGVTDVHIVAHDEAEALSMARAAHGPDVALVQESDVLDTWFSSALWPFSTLGWPQATERLEKFYPTQVMETGHDILFFWVARMVMMGIGLTGKLPFHTVFLHGLVRDEKGRKMSKSLGNVVDPLDVVNAQGADALRFTLATGTTPGQDLNMSAEKLSSNRNLTNKLWNAGKLVLLSIDALSPAERAALADARFDSADALARLPLAERWVVSRLHALVDRVHASHERYDFGDAGRAVAEFIWAELADWYLEACKTRLYSDDVAAAATTRAVLVYVMDRTLRLAHPFLPYVTEELWQALPHRGPALIAARAPARGAPVDAAAVQVFETLQAAVRAVRNARAEYNVEPARRVPAVFVTADAALRDALALEAPVLVALARLQAGAVSFEASVPPAMAAAPDDVVELLVADGLRVLLPVAGLADPAKEVARLAKQAAKLQADLDGVSARLNAPSFADKAPPAVVAKTRESAAQLTQQLAAVEAKAEVMRKMLAAAS
jgi:valyl-tRNA synthetase